MRFNRAFLVLASVLLTAAACTAPLTPDFLLPTALELIEGDRQTAPAGSELPLALVARVTDASGTGVKGVSLLWIGDGAAWADVTGTSEGGIATNYWTLGPDVGTQDLEVWTYDIETRERGILLSTFTATSTPP